MDQKELLFPFPEIRPSQSDMIRDIKQALENKRHVIAHAPTGLGKTAASISPALAYAQKHNMKVFFLTSRHTQHHICIETLKAIKKKYGSRIICTDLIGKQWMCTKDGVSGLYGNDFMEYCKKLREEKQCEAFLNTKKNSGITTLKTQSVLEDLKILSPMHVEELIEHCKKEKLCPYYTAELLARISHVIVADYFYLFHPVIRDTFLAKIEASLENSIIIIDEAHNLPKRCRELLSGNLSTIMVDRAMKEASKFNFNDLADTLQGLKTILIDLGEEIEDNKEEVLADKDEFIKIVSKLVDYEKLIDSLTHAGDEIRKTQKQSYLASISQFLEVWQGQDHGFARILQKKPGRDEMTYTLLYKCLDPSLVTKDVIDNAHSIICMSGTLTPTEMYADLLGFSEVKEKIYKSPFPEENKLSLIVPETTTKYTRRSEEEFTKIGRITALMANNIPGNTLVFFPSYAVRNKVYPYLQERYTKKILIEQQGMKKEEKQQLLNEFKANQKEGSLFCAVTAGSFGEGVDLPGDLLKGVIVVGLPLEKPSLEIKEVIDYYDTKFGKGMQYGYIYPAMIKTMQNAGRCIRSATDKGVVIYLDERYILPQYKGSFDEEDIEVTKDVINKIQTFFQN